MPVIYLIRHGQTDWNAARRYQGQRNIPLNSRGRQQARRNGVMLANLGLHIAEADFVASPLDRARETMEIVRAELDLDPLDYRIDAGLKEINYGHWEGMLADELPVRDPDGLARRLTDPFHWRPRGGESYSDVSARVARWLSGVRHDTVVASHGVVGRTLRGLILGLAPSAVLTLDAPQDRILVLRRGAVSQL